MTACINSYQESQAVISGPDDQKLSHYSRRSVNKYNSSSAVWLGVDDIVGCHVLRPDVLVSHATTHMIGEDSERNIIIIIEESPRELSVLFGTNQP